MASRKIRVQGHPGLHHIVENLGYSHTVGKYARAVMIDGHERIVVAERASGPWEINRPVVHTGLSRGVGQ